MTLQLKEPQNNVILGQTQMTLETLEAKLFLETGNLSAVSRRQGIFCRDGQCKSEDPPLSPTFVVSQALSFEAVQQTNKQSFCKSPIGRTSALDGFHTSQKKLLKNLLKNQIDLATTKLCYYCSRRQQHPRDTCPAQGETCSPCKKTDHSSSAC